MARAGVGGERGPARVQRRADPARCIHSRQSDAIVRHGVPSPRETLPGPSVQASLRRSGASPVQQRILRISALRAS